MATIASHRAVIQALSTDTAVLKLLDHSVAECEGCKLAMMCGNAALKDNTMMVYANTRGFAVGDHVNATLSPAHHWRAIALVLAVPLLLFLLVAFSLVALGAQPWIAVVVAMVCMVLYFPLLQMVEKRLRPFWVLSKNQV